ncbi:related to nuclear localization protein NPL6 [Rhynchosporium agropyri]|uniref:Related to nuclear localization protein NPL6 n=1 Tax=Rhynchosporium agropyri TaxID=914238 RepID=A0A1E1L6N6_9HELO|nr:related to nuclear localization protein NPL6 [Rhynchosporium agropyri]
MYSAQTTNGGNDGLGTINPGVLSSSGAVLSNNTATITPDISPNQRGVKRSRSPEYDTGDQLVEEDGDSKPRKRGRPMKSRIPGVPESPTQSSMPLSRVHHPQTPLSQTVPLPSQLTNITPTQSSPPKITPTKTVIKALPTVRDHTTDQLGPGGDEYIPREYDEAGEKKVTATGQLLEGRDYRCRTFFVPNRGDKLFMLATECARVLGYRDSYLLFNKNRSLYKIIATQAEKEDLIHQEVLPFSYRSRQIAIVTARSMFRQFGSRVIVNGRRVRDDYWETKAKKQGFTEEDLAGEKRPGAAKARDAAAAEANASASLTLAHHGDIVYSNNPGQFGGMHPQPQTVQPGLMGIPGGATTLPMITLAPDQSDNMRLRDYSNIQRPRQEITGPPYQDRTQASPPQELLSQAHQAAEYNKTVNQQRVRSGEYLDQRWKQPHQAPPSNIAPQPVGNNDGLPPTQSLQSPRTTSSGPQQQSLSQQNPHHMIAPQSYPQPPHQPNPMAQTPMRSAPQNSMRPDQLVRPSGPPLGPSGLGQGNTYGFSQQNQMWPPSQPQQSPQHFSGYAPHRSQHSPHIQQSPHAPPPQLRQPGSGPQVQPALSYPGMQEMGQGYPAPGRGLYQPDQGPQQQQYMQPSTSGPQPGPQGWAGQQPPGGSGGTWGYQ